MSSTTVTLYLDVVFFVYGLSFYLLGIVVASRGREESRFALARFIWLLAAFAFVHGTLEWMELWRVVRGDNPALATARPITLFVSYVYLFEFGRRMLLASLLPDASSRLPSRLLSHALLAAVTGVLLAVWFAHDKKLGLGIWSRYLLGFTGSMLTGFGFLLYCQNRIRPALVASDFRTIHHACQAAAFTFFLYGVLGGLVVPYDRWFPPAWLNYDSFMATVGLPVQLFRSACAILMSLSVAQLLWIFSIEARQRLSNSLAEARLLRHRDELILRSVAEGICGVGINGHIVFINQSALSMLGYAEAEVLGRPFAPPIQQASNGGSKRVGLGLIQQVLQDGQAHWGELSTLQRKDGSCFPVEFRVAPMVDEGVLSGAVVTFQDISERKQVQDDLDAHNKTLNAITSSTQDAIIMMDDEGKISFWNQGAEAMFGYTDTETIGENLHRLIVPQRFLPFHLEAFPRWQATGTGNAVGKTLEWVGVRKNGQEFPVEVSLSSVWLKQRWFAVGIVRDVTARTQQAEVLSQAKQAAEAANRAKSEFLANMSHEIRTPMNAILGLIQLVFDTPLTPKQDDFLRKAYASSRALLNILNDILDYSKIEAGHLLIERLPFRVEETLKGVADLHTASIAEKGLDIFLEIDPFMPVAVTGDAMRLTQVLSNLVGNAVKFTEHGEIHIKAEVVQVDGETLSLRFAVRDTGIGLSKDQMDRLFQAFTQGDSSITRKYGGTGLGLTICERLVALMGGEIAVSSTEGQGATFVFTIQVGAGPSSLIHPSVPPLEHCNILAVDDQETARIILKQVLDAWGLETHTASSGEEALAQIEEAGINQRPFDAVLLDWRMPGMSGLDVARHLHEDAEQGRLTHPLLVVMVTAYDKEELLAQADSIHLNGILTKPVTPSVLFNALVNGLNPQPVVAPIDQKGTASRLADYRGLRVLLVEDNAINQQVAAEFLKRHNLTVILASHGGEAVDWVSRESFDAVLMDLHMPTMDGLEATRRIRELPNGRDLPIIAMTAAVMPEDRERCAACGMVDFVCKPIDPEELIQVLQRWIKPARGETLPDGAGLQTEVAQPTSALPDFLPGFDLSQALHRLCGNRNLLARLLLDFTGQYAGAMAQFEFLLATGENAQAATLLHTLKGVASNLGAVDLALSTQQLEREIKASVPLISRDHFAAALASAMETISTQVRLNDQEPAEGELDRKALAELLTSLVPYLQEQEVIPDDQMAALHQLARNDLPDAPLVRLIHQIDQFDHVGAMANITHLVSTLDVELSL